MGINSGFKGLNVTLRLILANIVAGKKQ